MRTATQLKAIQLDTLREVANIASGYAATALASLVGRRTMISVPELSLTSIEEIPGRLGLSGGRAVVVVMHLLGDISGSFVFVMPEANARMLSAMLLGPAHSNAEQFDALARSAISETANILGGAYAGALGTMTRRIVMLSAPVFGVEPPDAVLARHRGSETGEHVGLCIDTSITFDGAKCEFGAHIVMLASPAALQDIIGTIATAWE